MTTIFRDEFTGTGLIADHTPDVGYGGTYYINFTQTVLSGGFVTFDNSVGGDTSGGVYGDSGAFLGLLTEGTYSVVFRTLAGVPPVTDFGAACVSLTYGYGGESWSVQVGFFPDGTCFMSGIDDEAFLLDPLEPDTTYTLTVTFTGEYQIIRLEELGVQKVIYYGPAGYDDPNPMLGIGDTSFGVGNYGKIDRIELVDVATLAPEAGTAEDGMDEGVGEDLADTMNVVTVDVVEAGVGDDLPLVDGEAAPQDVRDDGIADDSAPTSNTVHLDSAEAGVGADATDIYVDRRFFIDEFNGTELVSAHTPDRFYGPTTWTGTAQVVGGQLVFNPSGTDFSVANYGALGFDYGNAAYGTAKFQITTSPTATAPGDVRTLFAVELNVWDSVYRLRVFNNTLGVWFMQVQGFPAVEVSVASSTTYAISWEFNEQGFLVTGFGGRLILLATANEVSLGRITLEAYPAGSFERFELTRDLVAQFTEDVAEAAVGVDEVYPLVATDAVEAGIADDLVDPQGGALFYVEDVVEAGVSADGVATSRIRIATAKAEGIAADATPTSFYAMPRDNGVATDTASTFLSAREIARDAGVATDATDTRILQDVQDFGVAADSTSLAVALTVRDAGIAVDRAQSGTGHAMDVREAGMASDTALPLSFVDVREAGMAADVTLTRVRTIQNVREAGVAVDAADPRRASQVQARSTGVGADASSTQLVAYSAIVEAGVADDTGLFSRLYEAWVMNTQTTAMSRYTSLPFNSAAVIGGRVIGLGDAGFFELKGDKDGSKPIKALLKTGHLTLQGDKIKRLDDVTMGYTSTGTVNLTVAAYGGPLKGRWTYTSPPMPAASPRGTRVALGRGLQAKYYQFTIENTNGAAMGIDFVRVISNEFKSRRF